MKWSWGAEPISAPRPCRAQHKAKEECELVFRQFSGCCCRLGGCFPESSSGSRGLATAADSIVDLPVQIAGSVNQVGWKTLEA